MRIVAQRVSRASVTVNGSITGQIDRGLLLLVGIAKGDGPADVEYLAGKIAGLRVFDDEAGKMNRNLADCGGAILAVSQFTLYGDVRRGNRPSFDQAAPPDSARHLYEQFVTALRQRGFRVECGVFQAHMDVELRNDGPVTILLESRRDPGAPECPPQ